MWEESTTSLGRGAGCGAAEFLGEGPQCAGTYWELSPDVPFRTRAGWGVGREVGGCGS